MRERFETLRANGRTDASEIALQLGWFKRNGAPDSMRVTRTFRRELILYRTACRLADVLGLDPYEAGV